MMSSLKLMGEPWRFGFPKSGAADWVAQRHLKAVLDFGPQELTAKYLTSSSGVRIGESPWWIGVCLAEVPDRRP
jgi:hypothetical protein